jgi:hypothetical protein
MTEAGGFQSLAESHMLKGIFSAEGLELTGAPNRPPIGSMGHVGNPARNSMSGNRAITIQTDHPASQERRRKNRRKKTGEPAKRKKRMEEAMDPRVRDWVRPIPDFRMHGKKDRDAEKNKKWLADEQERRAKRSEHREIMSPRDLL